MNSNPPTSVLDVIAKIWDRFDQLPLYLANSIILAHMFMLESRPLMRPHRSHRHHLFHRSPDVLELISKILNFSDEDKAAVGLRVSSSGGVSSFFSSIMGIRPQEPVEIEVGIRNIVPRRQPP